MNIKNSMVDNIGYKQVNWYGHVRRTNEERLFQTIGMVSAWKKDGRTLKLVDAGKNN